MYGRRSILVGTALFALGGAGCTRISEETGIGDGGSGLDADGRGEIVETYDEGINHLNDGNEARDEGIIAFNEERYDASVDALEGSIEYYGDAVDSFRSAETLAEEAGVPPAAEICADAATHADLMGESTDAARDGSAAARDGEAAGVINDHIVRSQELQAEADESPVTEAEALLDLLEAE